MFPAVRGPRAGGFAQESSDGQRRIAVMTFRRLAPFALPLAGAWVASAALIASHLI
jgi:hypothetical protein